MTRQFFKMLFHSLLLACLAAGGAFAQQSGSGLQEKRTTLEDQQQVAVTIYNEDLALVRDQRRVVLDKGENLLAFREVSALIRPETALLRSLSHPEGFFLVEQNFDFDLLTPQKLLEKYVGRSVQVVRSHPQTGAERFEEARVLAAAGGVVLQIGERIETGIPGRLVYPDVPANLRDRPTLVTRLNSGSERPQQLELAYLTGGLSWQADYVAELSPADDQLDLSGWVTLTNRSGTSYRQARLQLVAGDVHRARDELRPVPAARFQTLAAEAAAPKMAEEALFEYHLYTLERPTTIAENQTKQVALLGASGVPVTKELLLQGSDYYYSGSFGELGRKLKVGVFVEFENREQASLGMPLPRGIVRVYKQDSSGGAQFVGEDRIDHTPKNEKVRLKLGEAFDVTADKTQTDFKKLAGSGRYNYIFESAYRIELKNAKPEQVTVKVAEPMPGDWEMVSESHPHRKPAAGTAVWEIPVPAEGKAVLEYRVRVKL
ncbi:DUF4139 domain-containing protein [Desulfuromonas versatilis]|uniref:DUF4139 domain-containing protein n=1 Tax=Desulfuromonas versatilis TaxID=2802975 RepID=A0ABM8I0Y3_9BACT|nr:DUF4139 domain-containing protein [Desulfuromonas versatilis]BCR06723.1 DUF4139 domain-containing protein [Desulfuromonas versatilis]